MPRSATHGEFGRAFLRELGYSEAIYEAALKHHSRGKLRKAREGKVVAGRRPNYGFAFNAARDGYEVKKSTMPVVRRIFRMAGVEVIAVHGIKRALDREGAPTPGGREYWHRRAIQSFIMDDVYKPHTFEEIKELVSPEVAARLDPDKRYGVWWCNRQRVKWSQVSEVGPEGWTYRRRGRYSIKDKSEWIAVPVPDAGIPRDLNAYVKEVMGQEFTAKDFRTWAGTLVAAVKLAELGATENLKAAEKNVVAAVDAVAQRLGNTRAIARSSYVSPRVIDHYMKGSVVAYYSDRIEEIIVAEQGELTEGEEALLELLQKKLRRELKRAA